MPFVAYFVLCHCILCNIQVYAQCDRPIICLDELHRVLEVIFEWLISLKLNDLSSVVSNLMQIRKCVWIAMLFTFFLLSGFMKNVGIA